MLHIDRFVDHRQSGDHRTRVQVAIWSNKGVDAIDYFPSTIGTLDHQCGEPCRRGETETELGVEIEDTIVIFLSRTVADTHTVVGAICPGVECCPGWACARDTVDIGVVTDQSERRDGGICARDGQSIPGVSLPNEHSDCATRWGIVDGSPRRMNVCMTREEGREMERLTK